MKRYLLPLILILLIIIIPTNVVYAEEGEGVGYDFWLEFIENNPSRDAGKVEELQAALFLEEYYSLYNLEPYHMVNNNNYLIEFEYTFNNKRYSSQNVAGVLKSENESAKSVIIGAHYDSVSNPDVLNIVGGEGAYDNASGLGVMIELMDRLSKVELDVNIIFMAFGAEELGLFGSRYIADNMSQEEIENTILMINIDSIACGDYLYLYTDEVNNIQEDYMFALAQEREIDIKRVPKDKKASPYENPYTGFNYSHDLMYSDHAPFMRIGIDVAFFVGYNMEGSLMARESESFPEIMHTERDNVEFILSVYGEDFVKDRIDAVATLVTTFIEDPNFQSVMAQSKEEKFNYRWMTNPTLTLVTGYVVKGLAIIGLFVASYLIRKRAPFDVDKAIPIKENRIEEEKFIFKDLGI